MTLVINPPNQAADGNAAEWPHVFLAGPIQAAPDWQADAIEMIGERDVVVCNPRTTRPWHGDYNGQVDWELENLRLASTEGATLFWLAKPDPNQKQPEGRAYAQTSRFELGEWVGRHIERDGFSGLARDGEYFRGYLVVGIEDGFTNERYIRRRLSNLWPDMPIPNSLGGTIAVLRGVLGWPQPPRRCFG